MSNSILNTPTPQSLASENEKNPAYFDDTAEKTMPMTEQLHKMKQLLSDHDTAKTFRQSCRLLLSLLKESAILLWLALCWAIVGTTWIIDQGRGTAIKFKHFREKLDSIKRERTKKELVTEVSQTLVQKSQTAIQNFVSEAKKQVGLSDIQS